MKLSAAEFPRSAGKADIAPCEFEAAVDVASISLAGGGGERSLFGLSPSELQLAAWDGMGGRLSRNRDQVPRVISWGSSSPLILHCPAHLVFGV